DYFCSIWHTSAYLF
nr:immunoglobulin light chain junction region [Macaca mulatta]MOX29525.1 immunoglobulin light chain junction region [Macaca mulatta]MOX32364.1 immunoglobulin light chain junction region [Macaca mulatta]